MKTYSEYRPTAHDTQGLGLEDRQQWLVVPVSRTRDSEPCEESNFAAALKLLGGESATVEVHRFGHWGPGWYEIILVQPQTSAWCVAQSIEKRLESYSILDEDDLSEREYNAAAELWEQASVSERLGYIKRCGADPRVSVFAARRDELPQGLYASELLG